MTQAIARHQRLAVDAAPLIYFLDDAPARADLMEDVIARVVRGDLVMVTSTLTELELLVGPMRSHDERAVDAVRELLERPGAPEVVPVTREIARMAADLRGRLRLAVPDAVVAATALLESCSALLSNDRDFERLGDALTYLHVDDLVNR